MQGANQFHLANDILFFPSSDHQMSFALYFIYMDLRAHAVHMFGLLNLHEVLDKSICGGRTYSQEFKFLTLYDSVNIFSVIFVQLKQQIFLRQKICCSRAIVQMDPCSKF
jgi:hypothetical protein